MKNSDMPATAQSNQEIVKAFMDVEDCSPNGLSKREAFAMAAMQGILSSKYYGEFCDESTTKNTNIEGCADMAVKHADALLKELEK